jgi:hypothetical protein
MFDDILGPDKMRSVKKSVKARLEKYYEEEKPMAESPVDEKCRPEDCGSCAGNNANKPYKGPVPAWYRGPIPTDNQG